MAISNTPSYQPSPPQIAPTTEDGRNLAVWMQQQLELIANALNEPSRYHLQPVAAPPTTPRTGDIAMNDGVNWNPGNFFEGSKQALFVYRNGTWLQADNGVMTVDDDGYVAIPSTTSGRPVINMSNIFADTQGCYILGNKARGPGVNSNSGDVALDLRGAGFANPNFNQHTAIQFYQNGPVSGGFIPGAINLYVSKTTQFDNTYQFVGGDLTIPEFLFAQFSAFRGASGAGIRTVTAATFSLTTDHFLLFNFAGVVTVTMSIFAAGSWIFMRNFTANAVNASAAVIDVNGALVSVVLPATIGAWALYVTDGTGTWYRMASNF